jgi:hypothetical protein
MNRIFLVTPCRWKFSLFTSVVFPSFFRRFSVVFPSFKRQIERKVSAQAAIRQIKNFIILFTSSINGNQIEVFLVTFRKQLE